MLNNYSEKAVKFFIVKNHKEPLMFNKNGFFTAFFQDFLKVNSCNSIFLQLRIKHALTIQVKKLI